MKLINIPIGETGEINGKIYRAEENLFGCVSCDLSDAATGCHGDKVQCYCPDRTFKLVEEKPVYEQDNCFDEPVYKTDNKGCRQGIIFIVLGSATFWVIIILAINYINSIIK